MNKAILRIKDVSRRTGLARSTIYEMMDTGTFPRPVKLGPRQVGWVEGEVDSWIAARIEERDKAA
ncbi:MULTISPECIES: AlpA family transcriptional regulator [unclassified Mesorhizobium]|uniref:helix-turn-helix transcriptional regulator n=1 Tax=unclassified Mesorhizobium TaxID=325217 RepID=UPI003338DFDD